MADKLQVTNEKGAGLLARTEVLLYTHLFKALEAKDWVEVREIEYHLLKFNLI